MVLEEGSHPLPRFPKCDMFSAWRALNGSHQAMLMRARGSDRNLKRLWDKEAWMSTEVASQAYRRPLEIVTELKTLIG